MLFRKVLKMQLSPVDNFRKHDMKVLLIVIEKKPLWIAVEMFSMSIPI